MKPTVFVIDSLPGCLFAGFTQGDTWNGWACPFFTRDEAQKIVAAHKENGQNAYYDSKSDAFAFEVASSGGDYDIFTGIEAESVKLYPIGARCWIWEEGIEES